MKMTKNAIIINEFTIVEICLKICSCREKTSTLPSIECVVATVYTVHGRLCKNRILTLATIKAPYVLPFFFKYFLPISSHSLP